MSCTYTFDTVGNKVKTQVEKVYAANSVEAYRVTTVTTYDQSGRILTEVYTYQESDGSKSQKTVTNSYDVFGRVVATTTSECELTSSGTEDAATKITFTATYEYDKNDNLTRQQNNDGTVHTYVYDKNNRVVTETQVNNWPTSSGATVNESITYEYDLASQLIKSVKTNLNDNSVETTEYGYDAVGNRTAEKIGNIRYY